MRYAFAGIANALPSDASGRWQGSIGRIHGQATGRPLLQTLQHVCGNDWCSFDHRVGTSPWGLALLACSPTEEVPHLDQGGGVPDLILTSSNGVKGPPCSISPG
jgi:hypothetical protein